MPFEEDIRDWVSTDNQLKLLQDKTRTLREKKNKLCGNILNYAEENDLNSAVIKISDGRLKFANVKQTAPLTLKYLEECLNTCIQSPEQVEVIMNYIKENRGSKYVSDIKRYYVKTD